MFEKLIFEILINNALILIETKNYQYDKTYFRFDLISLQKANAQTIFFFSIKLFILIFVLKRHGHNWSKIILLI